MTVPKAIFLDVGWTLVYPRESLWDIFAAVGRDAGTQLTGDQVERVVHNMMMGSRERALADLDAGVQYSDSDEEFAAQFALMGRVIFGLTGVHGDYDAMSARFLERFWTRENWAIFDDVIAGVERLRAEGIRVGVLSNAGSQLVDFLDQLDLLQRCDFTVVSAIERMKKPDSRIFARALERAGVTAADAVHVGDMYVEDILGARRVGLRSLLMDRGELGMFPKHPESANHPPDAVETVRTMQEVIAAIGLCGGD